MLGSLTAHSASQPIAAQTWSPRGGGEMGNRIRAFDWRATPVGAIENWPPSLRLAIDLCLNSRFPMFIWWGPELINIYNDAYAPIMGARHPAGLGISARDLWRELWDTIGSQADAVMQRGEATWNHRAKLITERNGYREEGYFTWSYSPIADEFGNIVGLFCAVTEETAYVVAERERSAFALRYAAQSRLYDQILSSIADFAYVFDLEGRFVFANKRLLELLGKTAEQVRGANFHDLNYPPILATKLQLQIRQCIESRQPVTDETEFADRTGHTGYYQYIFSPVIAADGTVEAVAGVTRELTDMVRSREALRESERRLRLATDAAEIGIWVWDVATDSGIWESERLYDIFGVPRTDAPVNVARLMAEFLDPRDVPALERAIEETVSSGARYHFLGRFKRGDGKQSWIEFTGQLISNEDGSPRQILGTAADVTEREQLLESERVARAEAENANRAKDKFLAVLSHELRAPLSPVVMTIPALEIDPQMPVKFREDLAMVRRNIELEVKLIDDLLDLSRVTSGKLRLQMQPTRLHELLRHVIQSSVSDIAGKDLRIREEFMAADDLLLADPARLQQVFWNLLRNAAKFTPDGGSIVVRSWNDQDSKKISVSVSDTGVGIEPHLLPKIFDAFEQGDARTTRQFGGLGLGLAIAKAVVEIHGGKISVHSEGRDKGATFTVELSSVAQELTAASVTPANSPSAKKTDTRSRVLLVEDHPDTSRITARLLDKIGFHVRTANSVTSALQLARDETFDVLVSDIGLPDATGYDLMRQIREQHGLKGIALSGYGMEEDLQKSRDAGFLEHLVKPIDISQLEAAIRRLTVA